MKVACFTVAAMDFFTTTQEFFAGGNALNQAVHFKKLGLDSAFIGAIGNDEAGVRIGKLLQSQGVDASHTHILPGHTASNRLYNSDDGERFGEDGAWQNGVYGSFRMDEADWAFADSCQVWSTHANCPEFSETLKRKKKNQILAVDFLHFRDMEFIQASVQQINIACFGGDETMVPDLIELAALAKNTIFVLTLGAKGSMAFQGKSSWRQEALPVSKVVDTTGCGDAFQSAFTHCIIHGQTIPQALSSGAEAGRITCQRQGAIPWF